MNPSALRAPGIGRAVPSAHNTTHPQAPFRRDAQPFEPQGFHGYQTQYHQLPPSPALFIPQQTVVSSAYGQPYTVYAVPTYYQPMPTQMQPPLMTYNFHNLVKPKKGYFSQYGRGHHSSLFVPPNNTGFAQNFYSGAAAVAEEAPEETFVDNDSEQVVQGQNYRLDVHMGVQELYKNIVAHFKVNPQCKVSWLNRLLAKCNTAVEFNKAVKAFLMYQTKLIPTTPETGTLVIKAACRAGLPEKVLEMLKDVVHVRIFPTLGGIHYLMINFSLKKDTKSVLETFQVTKQRHLNPTTRTYHILIRECVDNGLIDEAMRFAKESQAANIVPNRVTYNILMNGCRKFNKAKEILDLRTQMNQHNIEINDTTVKFTALAHMMLGNLDQAVDAFHELPELDSKLADFCDKFFEVTEDNVEQKKCVVDLLNAVDKRTKLPDSIKEKVKSLEV